MFNVNNNVIRVYKIIKVTYVHSILLERTIGIMDYINVNEAIVS